MAIRQKDLDRLKAIKRRQLDLRQNHAEDIKSGKFIRVAGQYFTESEWLMKVIEHLLKQKIEVEPEPEAALEDEDELESTPA